MDLYLSRWFWDLRRGHWSLRRLDDLWTDALLRVVRDQTLGSMDLLNLKISEAITRGPVLGLK